MTTNMNPSVTKTEIDSVYSKKEKLKKYKKKFTNRKKKKSSKHFK